MKSTLVALLLFAAGYSNSLRSYTHWDYDHMSEWSNEHSMCDSPNESPINIQPSKTTMNHKICDATFEWNIDYTKQTFKITNNGHTISLKPATQTDVDPDFDLDSTLRGADGAQYTTLTQNENTIATLPNYFKPKSSPHDAFCLDSIHFHWGLTDSTGSEHQLNGNSYPLELHFLHYSCQHMSLGSTLEQFPTTESVGDAIQNDIDTRQLAIVALFFDVVEDEGNPAFDAIFSNETLDYIQLPDVHEDDDRHDPRYAEIVSDLNLADLIPDDITTAGYYAYEGSLTSPPCTNIVRWHVMDTRGYIGASQLEMLRELMNHEGDTIAPNYREIQDNENTVYLCTGVKESESNFEPKGIFSLWGIIGICLGSAVLILVVSRFVYKKREQMKARKIESEKRAEINRNSLASINQFYTNKADQFVRKASARDAFSAGSPVPPPRTETDLMPYDI
eukprot:251801_1